MKCKRCQAVLSIYAQPSERYCAPCDRSMIEASQRRAYQSPTDDKEHYAFALRWQGLEWDSIARRLSLPSVSVASRSANRYAKRNGLRLP